MIDSGVKKEEYQKKVKYWSRRLYKCKIPFPWHCGNCQEYTKITCPCYSCEHSENKKYTHILFRRGYSNKTMLCVNNGIFEGVGNPDWGAPDTEVYIIKLGNRIN